MNKNLGLGLIALLFSSFYIWQAAQIPTSALGDSVGAGGVPLILGWIMAGFGTLLVVQELWLLRTGRHSPAPVSAAFRSPRALLVMAGGVLVIAAIYIGLLRVLGYIPATALFLAALLLHQRVRQPGRVAVVALGGAVVLWGLFDMVLGINLPDGPLAGIL